MSLSVSWSAAWRRASLLSQGTRHLVGRPKNDDFYGLYAHAFLNTAGLISAFIHVDNWAGLYSADAEVSKALLALGRENARSRP